VTLANSRWTFPHFLSFITLLSITQRPPSATKDLVRYRASATHTMTLGSPEYLAAAPLSFPASLQSGPVARHPPTERWRIIKEYLTMKMDTKDPARGRRYDTTQDRGTELETLELHPQIWAVCMSRLIFGAFLSLTHLHPSFLAPLPPESESLYRRARRRPLYCDTASCACRHTGFTVHYSTSRHSTPFAWMPWLHQSLVCPLAQIVYYFELCFHAPSSFNLSRCERRMTPHFTIIPDVLFPRSLLPPRVLTNIAHRFWALHCPLHRCL
jgi:hypothetical protein